MNWTGGRLQRHSKANGSATRKAQKQHFARARLQHQNGRPEPSPLRCATFKVPVNVPPNPDQDRNRGVKRRTNKDSTALGRSPPKRRRLDHQPINHHDYPSGRSGEMAQPPERGPAVEAEAQQRAGKSAHAERHTLGAVKRSLLRRSDWMGLNAARPLQMNFPSAEEMESIGRRRKITVNEKQRPEEHRRNLCHYATVVDHIFKRRQGPHRIDDNEIRDDIPSIRVGSNIHHSQPTPMPSQARNPRSVICQSESSESMLLDKEIPSCQQSIGVQSSPRFLMHACSDLAEERVTEDHKMPLVSLDQVRDSVTFDQVKARSDSIAQLSPGKKQQKSSTGLERRLANRNPPSSVVNERQPLQSRPSNSLRSDLPLNTTAQGPCQVSQRRPSQQAPDSLSSAFFLSSREDGYDRGESASISSNSSQKPDLISDGSINASQSNRSMLRRGQNQPEHRSKFTLEHQIEAEAKGLHCASIGQTSQPNLLPRVAREHSPATSHFSFEENEEYLAPLTASAFRKKREARLKTSPQASTMAKHRRTSAGDSNQKELISANTLQYSGRVPRSEIDDNMIISSFERHQAYASPRDCGPKKCYSRENPMRQRLGMSQQPAIKAGKKVQSLGPRYDEDQAWMRFVLQDDPDAVSNDFYIDSGPTRDRVGQFQRGLRSRTEDDETLPQHQEPQLSQTDGFSPVQTIRTNANTAIYEAHVNTAENAQIRQQPSETDFLSQFSPMEGHLDERLLNPSLHKNAARTERSYIPAPSRTLRMNSNDIHSDLPEPHALDVHHSPLIRPSHDFSSTQTWSVYSAFDPPSHSKTPSTRRASQRTPLRPIPNLFTGPRRSPVRPLQVASNHLTTLSQTNFKIAQPSAEESLGRTWIEPPSSANRAPSAARDKHSAFPMDFTPVRHTLRKRRRDHLATSRPSSSYAITSRHGPHQSKTMDGIGGQVPHSKMSFRPPSPPHPPFPPPETHNTAALSSVFKSNPRTSPDATQAHTSTTLPLPHLPHQPFPTSSPLQPSSPTHFVFQKPPQPLNHNMPTPPPNLPPPTANAPMPMPVPMQHRRTPTPAAAPFSTPRPMRQHLTLTPRRIVPFNTPGPVRSRVLGGGICVGW